MLPLIGYLPGCSRNRVDRTQRANFPFVKGVATRHCLGMYRSKVCIDGTTRCIVRPKAVELRMIPIPLCLPSQYRTSQQCFAPQRNQSLRVKVFRMDRPESHIRRWRLTMRLSDAGMHRRQTKLFYPNHRPLLGLPKLRLPRSQLAKWIENSRPTTSGPVGRFIPVTMPKRTNTTSVSSRPKKQMTPYHQTETGATGTGSASVADGADLLGCTVNA